MQQSSVTYYCDVSGDEIQDRFEMLELTVHRSTSTFGQASDTMHVSRSVHGLPYTRVLDNRFDVYLDDSDTAIMLSESGPAGTTHHGRDTDDELLFDLLQAVDDAVTSDQP